jgi:hypothetical protein
MRPLLPIPDKMKQGLKIIPIEKIIDALPYVFKGKVSSIVR